MATKTYFLVDGADADGWQDLSESTQGAATCAAGWIVGTGSTNNSELEANTQRASSTFTGSTVPDGTLDTSLKDAFRIPSALTGTFASGNWVFHFVVQSPTQGGAADGAIVFRLIKADADGSNATEITAAQQTASTVTNVTTSDADSTLTFNPGAITLSNQYLFVQVAWKRTGAGGMTTTNIRFRTGSASNAGTRITTTDFSATISGTLSSTLGALALAATATLAIAGTASATLGAATLSGTGTAGIAGVASNALSAVTLSASGTVSGGGISGTLNSAIDALTLSASGAADVAGSLSATLGAITASGSGASAITGSASPMLDAITSSAGGNVGIDGATSATLGTVSLAGVGTVATTGSLATTLGIVTVSGTGSVADGSIHGTIDAPLAAVTVSAAGTLSGVGALTGTLDAVTLSASGTVADAEPEPPAVGPGITKASDLVGHLMEARPRASSTFVRRLIRTYTWKTWRVMPSRRRKR